MTKRKEINRREFVTTTTGAAVAAALGPTIWVKQQQKTLKIIQWSHCVRSSDAWFDRYARDWGTARGVEVTVDHIALADLGTRTNAEAAAQQEHDLFQFLSPRGACEPQVLDMADVVQEAEHQNGPILDLCKRSTYNPVTRKWFGFSDNYVPDPGDYLKSLWTEIGMPDGPVTWEDLVKAAPLIKSKHPEIQIPIGIGMSQELDSNMAARAMLWSFDGSVQDQNENVVLKSDHALEALEFGVRLFKAGMNPSVMSWNAASNNQALNARQTGYILNSISPYRTAQDNKFPVADAIFFVPALKGAPGTGQRGGVRGVRHMRPSHHVRQRGDGADERQAGARRGASAGEEDLREMAQQGTGRRRVGRPCLTRGRFRRNLACPPPTRGSYDRSSTRHEGPATCRHRRRRRERDRVVRLLHFRESGRAAVGQVFRSRRLRQRAHQDGRNLHGRVPDPPVRSLRVRPHRRHRGPQVHLPHHAERHGSGDGFHRPRAELRPDRRNGGDSPVAASPHPGVVPRRRVWRRHHLRRRACAGRQTGLLHRLAADVAHARHRGVPGRHHPDARDSGDGGVQRVGVADPVPALAPHGRDRHLHPAAASGDADLPGHQGEGTDVGQSLARGLLESEYQIRADR